MTKGKTTRTSTLKKKKKNLKGTATNNYGPIMCLQMMWKILIAQIREEIYYSLINRGLFLEEQKGCRKGTSGTGELRCIDQHIFKEGKTRHKKFCYSAD